jgi:streptolysin S family bacteriocin protoxin
VVVSASLPALTTRLVPREVLVTTGAPHTPEQASPVKVHWRLPGKSAMEGGGAVFEGEGELPAAAGAAKEGVAMVVVAAGKVPRRLLLRVQEAGRRGVEEGCCCCCCCCCCWRGADGAGRVGTPRATAAAGLRLFLWKAHSCAEREMTSEVATKVTGREAEAL